MRTSKWAAIVQAPFEDGEVDPSRTRGDFTSSELPSRTHKNDTQEIKGFSLQCYRLNDQEVPIKSKLHQGKYVGEVRHDDGARNDVPQLPTPHGKGVFKTSSGYVWKGKWKDGLPHDANGTEILDGFPTASDPLLGSDMHGHWQEGKPVQISRCRSLEQRYIDGNKDQANAMINAG